MTQWNNPSWMPTLLLPQGFQWDVDGMLLLNEKLHRTKLIAVASRHGVALGEEDFTREHSFPKPDIDGQMKMATMKLHGAGDKNIYWWLIHKNPGLVASGYAQDKWLDELRDFYVEHARDPDIGPKPRPDMMEVVKKLHNLGVVQGIVTNGTKEQLNINLELLDSVADLMMFTLDADDVKHSKPDPEGYRKGSERIMAYFEGRGFRREDVIIGVGEDSPTGVAAAMSANVERAKQGLPPMFCVQHPFAGEPPAKIPDQIPKQFENVFGYSYTAEGFTASIENFFRLANPEPGAALKRLWPPKFPHKTYIL